MQKKTIIVRFKLEKNNKLTICSTVILIYSDNNIYIYIYNYMKKEK
jgi:hypothetical protein